MIEREFIGKTNSYELQNVNLEVNIKDVDACLIFRIYKIFEFLICQIFLPYRSLENSLKTQISTEHNFKSINE